MKVLVTKYQIAFSSYDGISPQKYEIYDSKEEAEKWCRKYDEGHDITYGRHIVIKKQVYVKGRKA